MMLSANYRWLILASCDTNNYYIMEVCFVTWSGEISNLHVSNSCWTVMRVSCLDLFFHLSVKLSRPRILTKPEDLFEKEGIP